MTLPVSVGRGARADQAPAGIIGALQIQFDPLFDGFRSEPNKIQTKPAA